MRYLLIIILLLSGYINRVLFSQTNYIKEFDEVTGKETLLIKDSVVNKSFVTAGGEKILRFEMVIDTSLNAVWDAFAKESEFTKWAVTQAKIDFRIGGLVQTHYKKNAKLGDPGTITFIISNYLPLEIITYKIILTDAFPEKCRNEDDNLQELVQFYKVGENTTKIVSSMFGWGEGKEWDDIYSKFEMGNQWTYMQLIKLFRGN